MDLGNQKAVSSQKRILKESVGGRHTGSLSSLVKTMTEHLTTPSQAGRLTGLPFCSFHSVWNPESDSYGMKTEKDKS